MGARRAGEPAQQTLSGLPVGFDNMQALQGCLTLDEPPDQGAGHIAAANETQIHGTSFFRS
jgi:hypothetical protein